MTRSRPAAFSPCAIAASADAVRREREVLDAVDGRELANQVVRSRRSSGSPPVIRTFRDAETHEAARWRG